MPYKDKTKKKANAKRYYEKNKEKLRLEKREYYKKNKDKIKIRDIKYRDKNKDEISERQKKYRERNKDKIRKSRKKYREENKEKISEVGKIYREKNIEQMIIKDKRWYEKTKKNICIICGRKANLKYCSVECRSIDQNGAGNSQWQGGKSFEPYPINWNNRFKRQIRKRDAYLCAMCGRHQDEFNRSHDVHHIDGDKMNTTEKNCISLCARHHQIIEHSGSKKYTFWMPKFQKILSKLYGYNYE